MGWTDDGAGRGEAPGRRDELTMLWAIFALLAGGAVFSVLWPLSRASEAGDARDLDVAFYRAQTAEIERDRARGLIGEGEAEAARTEAARRLVAAGQRKVESTRPHSQWPVRLTAIAALVLVPVGALGLYWRIGMPNFPDQPLQARLSAPPDRLDFAAAIAKIEQHLQQNPADARGWAVLAPIYLRQQRYGDAARAFDSLLKILGPSAERYAALAEAQTFAADGTVTPEARKNFLEAQKLDAKSPRAAYYLGLAAEQAGDKAGALAAWRKLVAESPADAPYLPMVKARIAAAEGSPVAGAGPSPKLAEAVAKMAPDQQQAMIHRMVDGLAARLKENGSDINGWLRLVRAYAVLKEEDKARAALGDAKRNFASDPTATKQLDDLALELGLKG